MRIALIADIHGNYPALTAVMADAVHNGAEQFIFLGDYIFDLPYSNEVTDIIRNMGCATVIRGNKEEYLYHLIQEDRDRWNADQIAVIHQTFRELTPENLSYLQGLKPACFLPLPYSGKAYAVHSLAIDKCSKNIGFSSSAYSKEMRERPFSHEEYLDHMSAVLQQEVMRRAVEGIDAPVILFGHSHLQWHGSCCGKLLVNPGSCGQPLDFTVGAEYTMLEDTAGGLTVMEKKISYDIESLITAAEQSAIYQKGKIWRDIVFLALRTGRDHFTGLFELAAKIAHEKNETGSVYSNETWAEAGGIYFAQNEKSQAAKINIR